jgi:hypothetical protein
MKELWKSRIRLESSFGFLSVIDKQELIQMKKKEKHKNRPRRHREARI